MPEHADWKRVGELLQQQRVRLDPRYRIRALFCEERQINYRLAQDIETGARDNYGVAPLTHIELAYGLEPGSISALLRMGALVRAGAPSAAPDVVRDNWADEDVQRLWALSVPEDQRVSFVIEVLARKEAAAAAAECR